MDAPLTPRLDIFIDYGCPWCYFATRSVALVQQTRPLEVRWRSFLLRPHVAAEGQVFGPQERVEKNPPVFDAVAAELNLPWPGGRTRHCRTQAAHVLMKRAQEEGRVEAYNAAVFHAYFVAVENVAERGVLTAIAAAAGLDVPDLDAVLDVDGPYMRGFESDLAAAQALHIGGVPTLVALGRPCANFLRPPQLHALLDQIAAVGAA